jgi:hypothetical protein
MRSKKRNEPLDDDVGQMVDRLLREAQADGGLRPVVELMGELTGSRPSVWAAIRLARSGRLDAVRDRGRWVSTVTAVRRYLSAETTAARAGRVRRPSATVRTQRAEAARRYLEALGVEVDAPAADA